MYHPYWSLLFEILFGWCLYILTGGFFFGSLFLFWYIWYAFEVYSLFELIYNVGSKAFYRSEISSYIIPYCILGSCRDNHAWIRPEPFTMWWPEALKEKESSRTGSTKRISSNGWPNCVMLKAWPFMHGSSCQIITLHITLSPSCEDREPALGFQHEKTPHGICSEFQSQAQTLWPSFPEQVQVHNLWGRSVSSGADPIHSPQSAACWHCKGHEPVECVSLVRSFRNHGEDWQRMAGYGFRALVFRRWKKKLYRTL